MVAQVEGWSKQRPRTCSRAALCALCRKESLPQRVRGQLPTRASRGLHGTWSRDGQQVLLSLETVPWKTGVCGTWTH